MPLSPGSSNLTVTSPYRPYPYCELNGRSDSGDNDSVGVRGGSWYDRPKRSRSAFRMSLPAWQKIYNVGFRVVIEPGGICELASHEE